MTVHACKFVLENKKKGVAWCSESGNETEIEITDEAESDNSEFGIQENKLTLGFTVDQAKQGASSKKKKRSTSAIHI